MTAGVLALARGRHSINRYPNITQGSERAPVTARAALPLRRLRVGYAGTSADHRCRASWGGGHRVRTDRSARARRPWLQHLGDVGARASLRFEIDLADIFAHDADA